MFTILLRGTDAFVSCGINGGSRAILLQSFIGFPSQSSQYLSLISELTELAILYSKIYLYFFMLLPGAPDSAVSISIISFIHCGDAGAAFNSIAD